MRMLLSAEMIAEAVRQVSPKISDYCDGFVTSDDPLVIAPVLLGSMALTVDLTRVLRVPHVLAPIWVNSYKGTTAESLEWRHFDCNLYHDRHILVVEDILDTGGTLKAIHKKFGEMSRKPASTAYLVAFNKNKSDFRPTFSLFDIPDHFVVGYGLDYNGRHRELPFLGVMEGM